MSRHFVLIAAALGLQACLASAPPSPPAAGLDWSAPCRWVHVDTVTPQSAPVFEAARRRWLATLRGKGTFMPDGRPLFWTGMHGGRRTYLTFYPFEKFAELDQRREQVRETQAAVGKAAVTDYDSGDAALVPPHYTQIWLREPDLDFLPLAGATDELRATHGRIEVRQLRFDQADRLEATWKTVQVALAKERYPLTCRSFFASYGSGFTVQLWLAPDAATLHAAPPLAEVLRAALGDERGSAVALDLGAILSTEDQFEIERRDDLSNLPPFMATGATLPPH
jgi:hypothetical protein